jgi:hypothetical protein
VAPKFKITESVEVEFIVSAPGVVGLALSIVIVLDTTVPSSVPSFGVIKIQY